jgi:transcriptional regulator with XRE-family HTH domain
MKTELWGQMCGRLRIEREITLRDFCKRVDVDPSNWSKIERGIANPPKANVINKICDVLEIHEPTRTKFHLLALIDNVDVKTDSVLDKLPVLISNKVNFKKLYRLLKNS